MKKTLYRWQSAGFIFVGIMGVLLHFLFDITGQSVIVAPFAAVNESVWEHIKILFFPMLVFAFIQGRFIGKEYGNFWCVKLAGTVLGVLLIPVLYYTIIGIFGAVPDWINILMFYVTAAIVYITETKLLKNNRLNCKSPKTAVTVLLLIALTLSALTFFPPHIPLFEDPITKTYGI